jgi:hypothetical protein
MDQLPLSQPGGFGVIYAGPSWLFRTYSPRGKGRGAQAHSGCLDLGRLAAMPVAGLAAKDAAPFLWATHPMLPQALRLIEAWGFVYTMRQVHPNVRTAPAIRAEIRSSRAAERRPIFLSAPTLSGTLVRTCLNLLHAMLSLASQRV